MRRFGIALLAAGFLLAAPQILAVEFELANTWIIQPNGSVANEELDTLVTAAGGTLARVHPEINIAVAVSNDPDFGINLEASTNKIRHVTRDYMVQWGPETIPWGAGSIEGPDIQVGGGATDPRLAFFYPCQWNMSQINAEGAWALGQFGAGAKVAVLDTGIDPSHIDLAGRVDLANSTSTLTPGSSPCGPFDDGTIFDLQGHGTFVSSLISGNGLGMASVAPDADILAVKVLNCANFGSFADILSGMIYAANIPSVDVISMSIQGGFPKNLPGGGRLAAFFNQVTNFASDQGKLVSNISGNFATNMDKDRNFIWLPGQAGNSIAAWAGDINGNLAGYSNYGRSGTWVGAPGGDFTGSLSIPLPGCFIPPVFQDRILGACSSFVCPGTNFYRIGFTGTSFAGPLVAATAAILQGKHGGALSPGDLKTTISNTADDIGKNGTDALFSHGRVNAGNAATQ